MTDLLTLLLSTTFLLCVGIFPDELFKTLDILYFRQCDPKLFLNFWHLVRGFKYLKIFAWANFLFLTVVRPDPGFVERVERKHTTVNNFFSLFELESSWTIQSQKK